MSKTIWIDLENTPHVPFFVPIVLELRAAGFKVVLTARDFAQTSDLVRSAGLDAKIIGGEYGNQTLRKVIGLLWRAIRLALYIRKFEPVLAVGHGSRGLVLAAKMLGIPSLTLYDYEGASVRFFNRMSTYVMTPEAIPTPVLNGLGLRNEKHLTYPGLKEDVYVSDYEFDESALFKSQQKIHVAIRPPSHSAHYRSDESFRLFEDIMQLLINRAELEVVLLSRTKQQRAEHIQHYSHNNNITIPLDAVAGLDLLFASDLVIGGGGTVNREAAALGVPVATIFKGPMGAVDRNLIATGRMIEISKAEEIESLLKKRNSDTLVISSSETRKKIVDTIVRLSS